MTKQALIKPRRLRKGDTIAVWSPSYPGPARHPRRFRRGVQALEALGYSVRVSRSCLSDNGYVTAEPKMLAREFHSLVADASVRCIMSSVGGWLTARILPHIDFALLSREPKILLGYSDLASLLLAAYARTDLVTFHGPTLLPELGEFGGPQEYTISSMIGTLENPDPPGELNPPSDWTDELLAWDLEDSRPRKPRGKADWLGLRDGQARGPIAGGCLSTVELLWGTPYMPDLTGHVVFLEEEGVSRDKLCALLTSLWLRGAFDGIAGLVFGRMSRPSREDAYAHGPSLADVAAECMGRSGIPVAWDVDLGHTEPMLTIPMGVEAELSVEGSNVRFALLEGAVS